MSRSLKLEHLILKATLNRVPRSVTDATPSAIRITLKVPLNLLTKWNQLSRLQGENNSFSDSRVSPICSAPISDARTQHRLGVCSIRKLGYVCWIDFQGVAEATLQGNSTRGSSRTRPLQTVNYRCLQKAYTDITPA